MVEVGVVGRGSCFGWVDPKERNTLLSVFEIPSPYAVPERHKGNGWLRCTGQGEGLRGVVREYPVEGGGYGEDETTEINR